ncbi:MAG: ZIP family metal transporter [Actinomycetota bacterium]|nr:ZIP family metal transporter [Actinomycetota bacterium]
MSGPQILLLGAIAGFTIFLGLPVGRIRNLSMPMRAFLNAGAAGILVFLLIEVFNHGFDPVEHAVEDGEWATLAGKGSLFVALFALGLVGLVYYDRRLTSRAPDRPIGPGAATAASIRLSHVHRLSEPQRLAFLIAVGIGLHNFSEGLAIGQSAANDAIKLALLLVIGFGLHNATEGFGIVGPLCAESDRPSWGFLGAMGLIAGGPTFLGTLVGQAWVSDTLQMAFLALAAGSILYVVVQLLNVGFRLAHKEMLIWGLLAGVVLGFATDLVVVAAGA